MAQAKVHNDVRLDIAQSDAKSVSGAINRDLITPFVKFNFGPGAAVPRLAIDIDEPEDVAALVESLTALAGVGVTLKASEARRRLRMSDPAPGDEVFGGVKSQVENARRKVDAARANGVAADPYADLDEVEDDLFSDWEEVMGDVLEPVLALLDGASSYEDASKIIAEAFPQLGDKAMIEALVKAAVKSRASGEAEDG